MKFIPSQQTKRWLTSFRGDFWGDIINMMNLDLFSAQGKAKVGTKYYPHTSETQLTGLTPVSSYVETKIYDGAASPKKVWGVAGSKKIVRSVADGASAFELDTSTGIPSADDTGTGSDLVSVPDESEEPIEVVEVAIGEGDGAVSITGSGNNTRWAQSFTRVNGPFAGLVLYIKKSGSPTDNLIVQIQTNNAGAPSGTTLTQRTLDAAQYTTDFVLYEYPVADWTDTTVQLDLDATYWIVLSRSGSADTTNYVSVNAQVETDVDNDPYENGNLLNYNGSTWARTTTYIKTDTYTTDGTFTVPSGVSSLTVETWASGAYGTLNVGGGGGGAYSSSVVSVSAAEVHDIIVGQSPAYREDGYGSAFNGVQVLCVAGGGGGGDSSGGALCGGGGGGGGFIAKTLALSATSYSVTVGAGGGGGAVGSNSVFGSLITALGGGGGGIGGNPGDNGSSGGGAPQVDQDPGTGTPGQGYNGGDGYFTDGAGGGGGAAAAGTTATSGQGGAGGAGRASSISGSSVTYGGGGGGGYDGGTAGSGGTGGGGAGSSSGSGTAGTANRGGGGGGASTSGSGGAGGSGVVIVRYMTGKYTATGGTITTSGSYTIHTFTSNGTFQITAINDDRVIAAGGLNGYNGGTGGATASGVGDTKYAGGNGQVGTGDRGGGGGAGSLAAGGNATDLGGQGGSSQGGSGGGDYNGTYSNGGNMYGGGGNSKTATEYTGARGEVRISYEVTATASYANVSERFVGRDATTTSHQVTVPTTVLPGDLLILVVSADGNVTMSFSGWTQLVEENAGSSATQTVFWKRATGDDSGFVVTSATTGCTWVGYRIINGDTPTATIATMSGDPNPPDHDAFESAKYLWIAAGTFSDSGANYNPTAAPTNYGNFIIETEFYTYDVDGLLGARTMVADRQLEAGSEDPGIFTGAGGTNAVASTIAVPYLAQVQYVDIAMQIQIEFPAFDERLYLTTEQDVKFLAEEDTIWQSLWQGVFGQDPLDENYPHPMKLLDAGGILFVGDGNKLHSMIATGNNSTEATPNRLVFSAAYYINWITITKSAIFIGLANKLSDDMPSQICYYEPFTEITRIFTIKEGATIGYEQDENCYIIDRAGQMRYYNGQDFKVADYFPPYYNSQSMNLMHRNGIFVRDSIVHYLWEGQYPYACGVWTYDDGRLYHRYGFVFDGVNLNSFGAIDPMPSISWMALAFTDFGTFASAAVRGSSGTVVQGIYSDFKRTAVTVESNNRAYFKTIKLISQGVDSNWQRIFAKYETRTDGEQDGSIILKQRYLNSPIGEGYNASAFAGTWTAATTFTSTTAQFITDVDAGNIAVGDEVIVRAGQGAGLLAQITAITGTTTKTVTIDSGLSDITSGTFTFSVENWRIIANRGVTGKSSQWVQVKAELRDYIEMEELQVGSKINRDNNE